MATDLKIEYLSQVVSAKMSNYACRCAHCEDRNPAFECHRVYRLSCHSESVSLLLLSCPDIATLLVGPNEVKLTCHKTILGFTSVFFEAALYGQFKEGQASLVTMPEENPEAISAYIMWAYSGQIESTSCMEELWVLGDRLGSPMFSNEVMHLMFSAYSLEERWLSARGADIAFKQTLPGSKLRSFVQAYIDAHGPLCAKALQDEVKYFQNNTYEWDWHALIEAGGELVLHITLGNGIRSQSYELYGRQPYLVEHQREYLLTVTPRDVEAFMQDKTRAN